MESGRGTEVNRTNSRIDEIMEGLSKLESKEPAATETATPGGTQSPGWRPTHMILGYAPDTERSAIEKRSNSFIARMGQGVAEACLAAYGPRKFGFIAKVRVRDGELGRVV